MGTDKTVRVRPSTRASAQLRTSRPSSKRVARPVAGEAGGQPWLRVATVAIVTAAVVVLAGGGNAFWLCLPPVLLVSALARTRARSFISGAAVTAAAALPLTGWLRIGALPDPALTLLVVAASVIVVVAVRERFERQHAALRRVAESDP